MILLAKQKYVMFLMSGYLTMHLSLQMPGLGNLVAVLTLMVPCPELGQGFCYQEESKWNSERGGNREEGTHQRVEVLTAWRGW